MFKEKINAINFDYVGFCHVADVAVNVPQQIVMPFTDNFGDFAAVDVRAAVPFDLKHVRPETKTGVMETVETLIR